MLEIQIKHNRSCGNKDDICWMFFSCQYSIVRYIGKNWEKYFCFPLLLYFIEKQMHFYTLLRLIGCGYWYEALHDTGTCLWNIGRQSSTDYEEKLAYWPFLWFQRRERRVFQIGLKIKHRRKLSKWKVVQVNFSSDKSVRLSEETLNKPRCRIKMCYGKVSPCQLFYLTILQRIRSKYWLLRTKSYRRHI